MALAPIWLVSLLLHALIGWRVTPALFTFAAPLGVAFGVLLALSAALVPMGLFARRLSKPPLSNVLTWLGLLAMGLLSTLVVLTLLREMVLLGSIALGMLWPRAVEMASITTSTALAVPSAGLLITLLGFWNARRSAMVVRVDVPITNLPPVLQGFTMAQISDIHVGPTIKSGYLQRIVDQVNGLQADLVAITGDLVDGSVQELESHVAPLASLTSTHGTFFVTGNHEYYSGAHSWIDALQALGIKVLMNEHVVIHHNNDSQDPERATVVVAGVADFSAHLFDESHRSNPVAALIDAPPLTLFKLLLAHQPRSAPAAAAAGFDLQLSGHTHGGQFWPWMYFVKFQQPFTAGLHKLESLWVYTSRGTGYWGPPKRFGAPSEITLLRLVRR
jgi:predicted MPP superfamily phosphohydrolase